jgi:DNA-binding CsgD family transcriptional regulator
MAMDLHSETQSEPQDWLNKLTAKEREVLDQILLHKPLKLIAHDLGITLSAVDQRLKSARAKLGARDRNEAARIYAALLATCRESTYGFEAMAAALDAHVFPPTEPPLRSAFMFEDSASFQVVPSDCEVGPSRAVPEVLDEKFGRLWRVVVIPLFAIIIAVLALALIAMANSLGELL